MIKIHTREKIACDITIDVTITEEKPDPEIIQQLQEKLNEARDDTLICFYYRDNDVLRPFIDNQGLLVYQGCGGKYYMDLNALVYQVFNDSHTCGDKVIEQIQVDSLYNSDLKNPISFRATITANIIHMKRLDKNLIEGILVFGYQPLLDLIIERLNPIQTNPIGEQVSQSPKVASHDTKRSFEYAYTYSNGSTRYVKK